MYIAILTVLCQCWLSIEFFPYCLFVSNSQVIGCEDRLWNGLYCVGWGVNSIQWLSITKGNQPSLLWAIFLKGPGLELDLTPYQYDQKCEFLREGFIQEQRWIWCFLDDGGASFL